MDRVKSYLQFFSIRRNLILLGVLLILLAIGATTYLVQQQQELRKRAQECPANFSKFLDCDSSQCGCEIWIDPDTDETCIDCSNPNGDCGQPGGPNPACEAPTPTSAPQEVCWDLADNDGDGLVDCDDPDCSSDPACQAPLTPTESPSQCNFDTICNIGEDGATCSDCPPGESGTACSDTGDTTLDCWFDSDCPGSSCDQSTCTCIAAPTPTETPTTSCERFGCQNEDVGSPYHQCGGPKHEQCRDSGTNYEPTDWVYVERWIDCDDGLVHFYTELVESNSPNCIFTIGGVVYVDNNQNGARDVGESSFAGATINLSGAKNASTTTDSAGIYLFTDLATGDYVVTLAVPQGFKTTTTNPVGVPSLSEGTTVNFGIVQSTTITPPPTPALTPTLTPTKTPTPTKTLTPTPTRTPTPTPRATPTPTPTPTLPPGVTPTPTPTGIPPGATALSISVNLEGFTGTYIPTRRSEGIVVDLTSQTANVGGKTGTITFSETTRHFEGVVVLGTGVSDGTYNLFVKATTFLRRNLGQVTIKSQAVNVVPFLSDKPLLSCDLNNDNVVDILDIGQVYTDIKTGRGTTSLADIDRDGDVDIFDHNFCVQNFLTKGDAL